MFTRSTPSVCGSTRRTLGQATIASREMVRELLREAASAVGGHKFSLHFLLTEWEQVVDAWQLENWEAYRDVARLGRKTRLPEAQRKVLWSIFERVRAGLKARKLITHARAVQLTGGRDRQEQERRSSTSRSWTRRRTSALLISGSSPPWGEVGPTLSFSPATSGSASSSSPSRGRRSAWIFGGVRAPCASITAPPTKSARRRTACSARW